MSQPPKKANFIASLPLSLSTDEVNAKLKAAGLGAAAKTYISKVRRQVRESKAQASTIEVIKKANGHSNGNGHALTPEQQLRKLVVVLGTERVRKLVNQYESLSWT